jgi:hypothetical protein
MESIVIDMDRQDGQDKTGMRPAGLHAIGFGSIQCILSIHVLIQRIRVLVRLAQCR